MKKQILLPHKCKWIGFGVLAVGISTFFFGSFLEKHLSFDISSFPYFKMFYGDGMVFVSGYYLDLRYTLQIFLIVAGGILIMFSKEKIEDEFTMSIRLKSLMYSVLINYIIVLVTDIFLYGEAFLYVMMFNFYTVIIFYVLIFNLLLFKNSRKNEK
jgi:hypothetical protein